MSANANTDTLGATPQSAPFARDEHIDFYRGLAFINMAVFHFVFNLQLLQVIDFNIFTNPYTIAWRGYIVTSFLLFVGVSLAISQSKQTILSKTNTKLLLASLAVSVATYIAYPSAWIYFGILHFILFAKIVAFPFAKKAYVSLIFGFIILLLFTQIGSWNPFQPFYGQYFIPKYTFDMVNIVPWLGVVFVGIFLGHFPYYKKLPILTDNRWGAGISWCGQNALLLYLTHQTALFPMAYFVKFLQG